MQTKKLTRSSNDRMIAGICGGLGQYLGLDSTIVRLIFVLLALAGGPGLLAYLIMWLIVPEADNTQGIIPPENNQQ
jgi:phage shock protein C